MSGIRHILHVHVAAFAVAVARLASPGLRGRPVAVGPLKTERGVAGSVSAEARRAGVFSGMPLRLARKMCPDLIVIEPEPAAVEKASKAFDRTVSFYSPVWEPAGPGHIYLDVTGTERLWGKAKDAAFLIGREIEARTGLAPTVGVSGSKMVSRIASRMRSREMVMDVARGTEAAFLSPLKVSELPGIGSARTGVLRRELGITRIGGLAALDYGTLACLFGRDAHVIRQRAVGIDPAPVMPPDLTPMVGDSHVFDQDTNDERLLLRWLYRLVEACSGRMRDRALCPGIALVRVRYSDRVESSRRCRLIHPGIRGFDLYPPVEDLFRKVLTRRVRVRYMEVAFRDLFQESRQLPLFDGPSAGNGKAGVIESVDMIRRRYGSEAIGFGRGIV